MEKGSLNSTYALYIQYIYSSLHTVCTPQYDLKHNTLIIAEYPRYSKHTG